MCKKVGVYFIFQPSEIELTFQWLNWVHSQCNESIQLFGIANGTLEARWKDKLKSFKYLHIDYSETNLGVAGGRNVVVLNAINWGAELLLSLDNDILIPRNYFVEMAKAYYELQKKYPKLGIITPAILDINRLIELFSLDEIKRQFLEADSIGLRKSITEKKELLSKKDYFYHLGASGWKGCYLISSHFSKFFEKRHFKEHVLSKQGNLEKYKFSWHKSNKEIRDGILNESLPYLKADTLPGGLHVYEKSYIDRFGFFDERFNPYGFEDSELCIRGVEAGMEHFLVGKMIVAHDLEQRFQKRDPSVTFFTRGKVRRILIKKHIPMFWEKYYLFIDTFLLFPNLIFKHADCRFHKKVSLVLNMLFGFMFIPKKRPKEWLGIKRKLR